MVGPKILDKVRDEKFKLEENSIRKELFGKNVLHRLPFFDTFSESARWR